MPLFMIVILIAGLARYKYLFGSHTLDFCWEIFCMVIAFIGLGLRIYTIGHVPSGTSGRNTLKQEADVLNTTGIYSIVRHPLYLGNFIIWFGVSLFTHVWWISLIFALVFWLYYERIMLAEEAFLLSRFGDKFNDWSKITPAFIPRFKNWKKPNLPFSWKTALRKEYSGFYAIIVSFTFLEIISDLYVNKVFSLDRIWLIIFIASTLVYIIIRFLKKKTGILLAGNR